MDCLQFCTSSKLTTIAHGLDTADWFRSVITDRSWSHCSYLILLYLSQFWILCCINKAIKSFTVAFFKSRIRCSYETCAAHAVAWLFHETYSSQFSSVLSVCLFVCYKAARTVEQHVFPAYAKWRSDKIAFFSLKSRNKHDFSRNWVGAEFSKNEAELWHVKNSDLTGFANFL